MKSTATIYARANYYSDLLDIYKVKPVVKSEKDYFGDTELVVKTASRATISQSDLINLVGGRDVPEGRTVKITLRKSATARKGTVLFAANLNGMVELFKNEPTIISEKEERLGNVINYQTYERAPSTTVTVKRVEGSSLVEFCARGFRRGTGLSIPKNKVTRLVVTTKTLAA